MTASDRNPSYFNSKIHSGWSKGKGLRDNGMGWNAIDAEYQNDWRRLGERGDTGITAATWGAGHNVQI